MASRKVGGWDQVNWKVHQDTQETIHKKKAHCARPESGSHAQYVGSKVNAAEGLIT